jgi:hypothetical protein
MALSYRSSLETTNRNARLLLMLLFMIIVVVIAAISKAIEF